MIKVEIYIQDSGKKTASVRVAPKVLKDGPKPTPVEVAAWQEMRGRIFAATVKKPTEGKK